MNELLEGHDCADHHQNGGEHDDNPVDALPRETELLLKQIEVDKCRQNTIHEHCSGTTDCPLRCPLQLEKDIEIQHRLEVVENERKDGEAAHLHHAVADVLRIGDEEPVRLHLAAAAVEQLVHRAEVEREGSHAGNHHQNADDRVPDGGGREGRQDVSGHAVVRLVKRQEHEADDDVDDRHDDHGHGDGLRDALLVGLLHVLLEMREHRECNGLRQTHERERQRVEEHAQVVEDAVWAREPEARIEFEAEVHDTVEEENDETDDERRQSEGGNGHEQTKRD